MQDDQTTPLHRVRVGTSGQLDVTGPVSAAVQRLMAMGLTPGTPVKVMRIAPLGDPIVLEAPGFQVSLRKHEASGLVITSANG